ncbi:hypothetical protein [Bradyrhizobium sp. SZCCHNRI3043]|uniref:hypothetical protein n=1 Tax=Bradyrhizobium sp. SZCCHNRI3043 TaxID=3057292 RepID=UPI0028E2A182|nr:hypothetical protein [Bradyrhizobium sp. SZCCHNRI3043]
MSTSRRRGSEAPLRDGRLRRRPVRPLRHLVLCLMLCVGCLLAGGDDRARADRRETNGPTEADSYQAYVDQIGVVEGELGPAVSPILGIILSGPPKPWPPLKSFKKLQQLSARYPDFCLRLVSDPKQTPIHRAISLWSMRELGRSEFISFLQKMVDLRERDQISSRDIELALWPFPPDAIICNTTGPDVRLVLQRILGLGDLTTEFKSYLDDILSGKVSKVSLLLDPDACSAHR